MHKRVIAVVMALIILLSVLYVFYGKNWLAEQQYLQKQKSSEFMKNELMDKFLEIQEQSQEILNEILNLSYEIEFFPDQEIIFEREWSRKFDFELTKKPYFDHKYIYLVSKNALKVFNKKCEKMKWEKSFVSSIISIELIDANRLLVLTKNERILCLHRDNGKLAWKIDSGYIPDDLQEKYTLFQISLDKYKRLDSSVILMLSKNKISLLNNINGKTLSTYIAEEEIRFISDFDILEKCIYIVEGENFSKIGLKVKS